MTELPPNGALRGRVALVTGAASNIGRATAIAVAEAGGRVLATDIDPRGLEETASHIRAAFGNSTVATRVADLARPEAPEALVAAAVATHGRLDVVVHAAVDHGDGRIESLTHEQWHRAYAVNVGAAVWLVRAALPHLERAGGAVVLFSSVQAKGGIPGCSLYGSTKAAIEGLTKHLAVELGPRRIRVNAISPGRVTDSPDPEPSALTAYPLGRYGKADEIASAAVFLASDAASWMTGSIVSLDGGMSAISADHASSAAASSPPSRRWATRIRQFGGRNRP